MQIHIEAPWKINEHFDAFVNEKLQKLLVFEDRIIHAEVFLKLAGDQASTKNKQMEVILRLPGPEISAKSCNETFEQAVIACSEKLKTQLIKRKEKRRAR